MRIMCLFHTVVGRINNRDERVWHGAWDIWQFISRSGDAMAILAFREHGMVDEVRVTPRMPSSGTVWSVRFGDGDATELSADTIAREGIRIRLPEERASEIIWLTAME